MKRKLSARRNSCLTLKRLSDGKCLVSAIWLFIETACCLIALYRAKSPQVIKLWPTLL